MNENPVVVVGAGQAGIEFAVSLRNQGHAGALVLVGEEPQLPYRRPPLSKLYLAGKQTAAQLQIQPEAQLAKLGIEMRSSCRAVAIDRSRKRLRLAEGGSLTYSTLVLAQGGRPRRLPLAGAEHPRVSSLHRLGDADVLRERLKPGCRLAIVGGGYIGLEVAATARGLGCEVTVLEAQARVLARVTGAEMSAFYERVHREAGVRLRTGVQIAAFEHGAGESAVVLGTGEKIAADAILVGIGLLPNTELAAEAGLAVDNGITVDEFARSTDPDILAVGDCANHPSALYGRRIRLESVQNAMEQSRAAAATLAGKSTPYAALPWFWSDQYQYKLQMAGLSQGYDRVVLRGDPLQPPLSAFYLKEGVVLAADTVSSPQDHQLARRLITEKRRPAPEKLADVSLPLKDLLEPEKK